MTKHCSIIFRWRMISIKWSTLSLASHRVHQERCFTTYDTWILHDTWELLISHDHFLCSLKDTCQFIIHWSEVMVIANELFRLIGLLGQDNEEEEEEWRQEAKWTDALFPTWENSICVYYRLYKWWWYAFPPRNMKPSWRSKGYDFKTGNLCSALNFSGWTCMVVP